MAFQTAIAKRVARRVEQSGSSILGVSGRRRGWRGHAALAVLGVFLAFSLSPVVASALPPGGTIVISSGGLDGWAFGNTGSGGPVTATTAFVAGPGTAPLGAGSLEMSVGANGDGAAQIRHSGYDGVLLSGLTTLSYSTYVSAFAGCQATYVILNLDLDGDGAVDDLLFFEPCYQTGAYSGDPVPPQGDPALGAWQSWDGLAGGWWSLNDGFFGPPLVTLSSYVGAHPGAAIRNTPAGAGGLRLVAGFGAGAWDGFLGNVDALAVGVGPSVTTFDFEPAAAPAHLDVGSDGGVDFDFPTIQGAVDAAADGDTVLVDAGTFPELVVVTKTLALRGAQAGVPGWARPGASESVVGTSDGGFQVLADGVVIDGFTIEGVVGASGVSSLGAGIWTGGSHSGYGIRNNILRGNTMGIFLNSDGTLPTVVEGNWFDENNAPGAASGDAIYSDIDARDIAISDNRFTGHESAAIVFAGGFLPGSAQTDLVVAGNEFIEDAGSAVFFTASDIAISGNTWTGSLGSSVALGPGVHGVAITGNEFLDGDFRGLRVLPLGIFGIPGDVSDVEAHGNSFDGNGVAGIEVAPGAYSGILEGDCNWWGDVSGPTIASNAGGTGDAILDPDGVVDYSPFLGSGVPGGCPGPVHLDLGSDGDLDIDFGAIQTAVDFAVDGDTVYVDPGVYVEQVVIDVDITLVPTFGPLTATILAPPFGGRSTFTIPSSGRTWDAIVEVRADGATVEGFAIDGNEAGGFCSGRSFTGIMMHGGLGMAAVGNLVTGIRDSPMSGCQAGTAIVAYPDSPGDPASASILGNTITDYQKGGIVVNVEGVDADVLGNTVVGIGPTPLIAQNGIQFGFGATGSAMGNTVAGHAYTEGFWTSAGILLFEPGDGVVVAGNLVMDNQIGVDVWSGGSVAVEANTVSSSGLFTACGGSLGGIDLFGIHFQDSLGTIADNTVGPVEFAAGAEGCQSGVGIVLDGTTAASVAGNTVTGYQKAGIVAGRFGNGVGNDPVDATIALNTIVGWGPTDAIAQNGIQVGDGAFAAVSGNSVSGNLYTGGFWTATGILVFLAGAGTPVLGNDLDGNQAGVYVVDTDGVSIDGNSVSGSGYGIVVDASDGVAVAGNTVADPVAVPNQPEVIGIWVADSMGVSVSGNDVLFTGFGGVVGTLYGISFEDASGSILGNDVVDVRMDSALGLQTGIGVIAVGVGDVNIVGNGITGYQKGGIVAGRVSVPLLGTVNILENTVTGLGPVPEIAQNGIQVSGPNAQGLVADNAISGNEYTGCSPKDAAHTGCIPWVATGLLLYNVNAEALKHRGNLFRDNQRNLVLVTAESLAS